MTGPSLGGETPPSLAVHRVLVAATCVFFLAAPFSGSAGARATVLIVAALALGAAALRGGLRDAAPFPRAVLLAFAAWAALATASTAWSVDRAQTLGELRGEVVYGALALFSFYFAATDLARLRAWVACIAAGCVLVMLAQGVQSAWPYWPNRVDGGGGSWSTHLALVSPLLLALAWPRPWGFELRAVPLAIAFVAMLIAGWVGDNRMLWVAFAVQLAALAVLSRHMPPMEAGRLRAIRRFMVLMAIVLAIAAAAMVVERNEKAFAQAPAMTHLERDLRPAIWRTAIATIREAPVWGHGFGREIRAEAFRPLGPGGDYHPEIHHAHNVFLDVALQLGLVGLAVFVSLLAALALSYARLLASPRAAPLGLMGLLVLAGFVAKNIPDDFFHRHNAQVFWALNGLLLGLGRRLAASR